MKRKFNKIFGIGLTKTGTHSLSSAINKLGFNSVHDCGKGEFIESLRFGKFKNNVLMDKIDALCHIEASAFFEQWDINYPNSKFILTLRHNKKFGLNEWTDSVRRHNRKLFGDNTPKKPVPFSIIATYGCVRNEERHKYVYRRHCREVVRWFKDRLDDLLVLNITTMSNEQMSIRLCEFLDVPVNKYVFPTTYVNWKYKSKISNDERRNVEIRKLRKRYEEKV